MKFFRPACRITTERSLLGNDPMEKEASKTSLSWKIERASFFFFFKLTTAGYFRPSGKNIDKPSAEGTDEWGVSPNEGFEVIFSDEQTRLLREARQDSDIVLNGATHDPREGKEYLKLVDTQLMKAQNYLYSELQLPEL